MKKLSYSDIVLSFIFPHRCAFCGRVITPEREICKSCAESEVKIDGKVCKLCGLPKEFCSCGGNKPFYDAAASVYVYENNVKKGILHYKSGGNKRSVKFYASQMAKCFNEKCDFRADFIVFIPHTAKENKTRGFDQNRELAAELSRILRIPVYDGMLKLYETSEQKRIREKYRKGNVAGVFDLANPEAVNGKKILLVDDVRTTGATLGECSKMLKLYDADKIFALTFAAAVRKPQRSRSRH